MSPIWIEPNSYFLNAFQHFLVFFLIRNKGLQQEFLNAQTFVFYLVQCLFRFLYYFSFYLRMLPDQFVYFTNLIQAQGDRLPF